MIADDEDPPETKLDMTPMIDCVFQLLIFFMIGCKFRSLDAKLVTHLPKNMGESAGTPPPDLTPTYIRLETREWGYTQDGRPCTKNVRIVVGDEVIGEYTQPLFGRNDPSDPDMSLAEARNQVMDDLLAKLKYLVDQGLAGNQESSAPTIILPDPRVPCDDVIQAIDVILEAGLTNVSFGGHVADLEKMYREDGLVFEKWD